MTKLQIGDVATATLEDEIWTVEAADDPLVRALEAALKSISSTWTPAPGVYYPDRELAIATYAAEIVGGVVVENTQEPLPEGAIP